METTCVMSSNPFYSALEGTFDHIQSPQYMDFNEEIPQPRDSFFDLKKEDQRAAQKNRNSFQKLPIDFDDNFIKPMEVLGLSNSFINPDNVQTSTPFRVEGVEPIPWRSNANVQANVASVSQLDKQLVEFILNNNTETKQKIRIEPFTFEERNKQLQQRKAQRMKTILQAEKDARKFRANPIPTFLKKNSTNNARANSASENKINKPSSQTLATTAPPRFRARSPKVLRRPPFQPILPKQPLAPPPKIILNSELRAKERERYDNLIKEKERLDMELRQLREAAQKKREEEEILKMRREMVPKAQPIKKFKCFTTSVAKRPLTEPTTPIVIKRQRR